MSDDGGVQRPAPGGVDSPAPPGTARARSRGLRLPPLFSSLHGYQRAWLSADLLAGVTLLVIAVPEQLATSRLAGMPPITGFYAFVAGTIAFALLGSSPQMSVGADSTIAPLFAVGVARFAATGSPHYVDLIGILALMVGAIVALIGILRLGWIADLLSAPIIAGFMCGIGVIIVVHQLPDLFGLAPASGSTLSRISDVISHLGSTNAPTLVIGLAVFAIVVGAHRFDRKLPGALVGLLGSTIAVAAIGLRSHGVDVLGTVAHGAPRLGLFDLSWSALSDVAPLAGVVALVVVSQSAATTRAFADQGRYEVDVGRDFIGVGAGSIAAGLLGSFPVDASPARTAAVASVAGRTQAAGLGAAVAVIALIPAAGLLKDVPLATLAAVLIYIATRIFRIHDMRAIARFDRFEFALALITLLVVALIGVEQGIGVAVGLAILDRTRITARPGLHVLGCIPGSTSWVPLHRDPNATQVPSVLALLFATPLWYANAVHFHAAIKNAVAHAPQRPDLVVLDALGMTDIDFTGSRALNEVLNELTADHIVLAFARVGDRAREGLRRSGLESRIGADHFFASVDEAVKSLGDVAARS
ncbi:MAG TPA: SulP family inorganic anion transporter [Solirubrobacteraceae bacterium]